MPAFSLVLLALLSTARADEPSSPGYEPLPDAPAEPAPAAPAPPAPAPAAPAADTGPVLVDFADVEIKKRPEVDSKDVPAAAAALPEEQRACTVRVTVDTKGKVTAAEPQGCAEGVAAAAQAVAKRYFFWPYKVDGAKVPFRTDVTVRYKL